jgi:Ni/Co efflux regulator RcnB
MVMRKVILSILLAGAAATPAIAQDSGPSRQEDVKDARQAAREARQEQHQQAREQRSNGADVARAQPQAQQAQPQPQVETRRQQWQSGSFGGRSQGEAQQQQQRRGGFEQRNNVQADVAAQQEQQRQAESRDGSRWTRDRSNSTGGREAQSGTWSRGDLRQGDRATPNVMRDRNPTIVNDQRTQAQQTQNRRWASGSWNRDWRNDRRYDWRRYRNSHRSTFHIGIYYDPFGYNYRPFNIGYRLYPAYFGQQYWIDPGLYQLPYPPPGTMWVRYWDDALLVDTYTGEVVDVIRNFFW